MAWSGLPAHGLTQRKAQWSSQKNLHHSWGALALGEGAKLNLIC